MPGELAYDSWDVEATQGGRLPQALALLPGSSMDAGSLLSLQHLGPG